MKASLLTAATLAAAVFSGCHSRPEDLRVWRPSDHDQPELSQTAVQNGNVDAGSAAAPRLPPGITQVVLVAWRQNCTRCHGMFGKGDGPQGPMVGARDLTDPKWQSATSDAQIAQAIEKGLGRMPHFDFPNSTVKGLVKLVRMMNAAGSAPARAGAAEAGAPAAGKTGAVGKAGKPAAPPQRRRTSTPPPRPRASSKRLAASGQR